jgi:hypothetical protein
LAVKSRKVQVKASYLRGEKFLRKTASLRLRIFLNGIVIFSNPIKIRQGGQNATDKHSEGQTHKTCCRRTVGFLSSEAFDILLEKKI